jgi:branched-chain amino acid transport system substrate-binding protein
MPSDKELKKESVAKDSKESSTEKADEESTGGVNFFLIGLIVVLAIVLLYTNRDSLSGNAVLGGKGEVIKLGFMGPLTGDAASYGESIRKGVDLALGEANLKNVEIVYEDSKCEGKEAVSAINKLINIDGVSAIVGEVCSGATLAAAPIAETNNVVMISASSTSPKITKEGDYIFRTIPSDTLQGAYAARLITKDGKKKLAILYSNEEYGVGFSEVVKRAFSGEVVASEAFERGATDLRTQITKVKSAKPDAILVISNSPDASVAALKQIRELRVVGAKIYGSEGLKGPEVAKTKEAEGITVTSVTAGSFEFALKYQEEYNEEPGPFAAQAYDAMSAIARSIKKGASTGTEVKNELYSMSFEGASGTISFDLNGDVLGNYEVYQLKKGEWVQLS